MHHELVNTALSRHENSSLATQELVDQLVKPNTALILVFFSPEYNYREISDTLSPLKIPFIGCMDAGRMANNEYLLDKSMVGYSISKEVIEKVGIGAIKTSLNERDQARDESRKQLVRIAEEIGLDIQNPMEDRDFIINLGWGLGSASPMLDGQSEAAFGVRSVGGSSGGKLDFKETYIVSSQGCGSISTFALIRLKEGYSFLIDRISSFTKVNTALLKVTKLNHPREIAEINHIPAVDAFEQAVKISPQEWSPKIFATYTLGLEPGDGERLITSIMTKTDAKTLVTYNDVIEGTEFSLFKAESQKNDRYAFLKRIIDHVNTMGYSIVGYISFDCILCYLERSNISEVHEVHAVYKELLAEVPKIGFGTFSENQDGSNVNQTETPLVLLKKR